MNGHNIGFDDILVSVIDIWIAYCVKVKGAELQEMDFTESIEDFLLHLNPKPTKHNCSSYANSMDLNETPNNSASHPDPSCLILRQHFSQTLGNIEAF